MSRPPERFVAYLARVRCPGCSVLGRHLGRQGWDFCGFVQHAADCWWWLAHEAGPHRDDLEVGGPIPLAHVGPRFEFITLDYHPRERDPKS